MLSASRPRIVLVEPLQDSNVGSVARAMLNFGYLDLYLVRPRAPLGLEATKWGKHAGHILSGAKKVSTLEEAVRGCSVVVGTTGVVDRFGYKHKSCLNPAQLAKSLKAGEPYALVFGSEDAGLSFEELDRCDLLCSIPVDAGVMNLSHSAAVLMCYLHLATLQAEDALHFDPAPREEVKRVEDVFRALTHAVPRVRDKEKVERAFRHVLDRARPTSQELGSMLATLGELERVVADRKPEKKSG